MKHNQIGVSFFDSSFGREHRGRTVGVGAMHSEGSLWHEPLPVSSGFQRPEVMHEARHLCKRMAFLIAWPRVTPTDYAVGAGEWKKDAGMC
jgi:hypothetical protein